MRYFVALVGLLAGIACGGMEAAAQKGQAQKPPSKKDINEWTVGLAGGNLEGAPIRFAAEIARAVDDAEKLHVLPIVTRGPTENLSSLLYLRGVDVALINLDALEEFKAQAPNINQRITYILNLFPSELHVFVRPEIKSLEDLAGKKVNFNTKGTAAAYSGPLMFEKLGVRSDNMFIPHPVALEQLRSGEIAAVVFVSTKPIDTFTRGKWDAGFKFLPIPFNEKLAEYYLPSQITAADYPGLVQPAAPIETIAVPTILAAFNWPKNSDRYRRVARFSEMLFEHLDTLKQPGFHPRWKEVNVASAVPGLQRFPAAEEWLRARMQPASQTNESFREQARRAAPNDPREQERLFNEFLKWRKSQGR